MVENTSTMVLISQSRIPEFTSLDPDEGSIPTAELVECTCPEFCERDHDTD